MLHKPSTSQFCLFLVHNISFNQLAKKLFDETFQWNWISGEASQLKLTKYQDWVISVKLIENPPRFLVNHYLYTFWACWQLYQPRKWQLRNAKGKSNKFRIDAFLHPKLSSRNSREAQLGQTTSLELGKS